MGLRLIELDGEDSFAPVEEAPADALAALVERRGAQLLYLPPDVNLI